VSKKKNVEGIKFAAVRILVHRTTIETGYADVLVPTSIINSKMIIRACDDFNVRQALCADADCIKWLDCKNSTRPATALQVSITAFKGKAGATHALLKTERNDLGAVPIARVLKDWALREVTIDHK
jgi:hypothetical protein